MKTVVSIPDDVLERAQRLARRLGVSLDKVYDDALTEYLARRDAGVTKAWDRLSGETDTRMGEFSRRAAARILERQERTSQEGLEEMTREGIVAPATLPSVMRPPSVQADAKLDEVLEELDRDRSDR